MADTSPSLQLPCDQKPLLDNSRRLIPYRNQQAKAQQMENSCSNLQNSPGYRGRQDGKPHRKTVRATRTVGVTKVLNPHSLWPALPCQPSDLSKVKLDVSGFEKP